MFSHDVPSVKFPVVKIFSSLNFHSVVNSAPVLLGFDPASLGNHGHFDLEYETTVLSSYVWNPGNTDTVASPKDTNLSIFLNLMVIKISLNVSFTLFSHCVY